MYEAFFKFSRRPFAAAPEAENYFPATAIETARRTLARCIERGEGAGLVIGPVGSGKTLLCQVLAAQFKPKMATALLLSGQLGTRRGLLQAILFELGLPYRGVEEGELRLSLIDHLSGKASGSAGVLLLVDEAHSLSWRLMEELRMITNLVRDSQPRVKLVLVGNVQLEERFASPKMDSFSQRLAGRCYLETLRRDETFAYAKAQITMVGADPAKIFSEEALQAIFRATDGVPRLINQVCDHALLLSSLGGQHTITAAAIEEAWSDLQQLPNPWQNGSSSKRQSGGVVEFGGLDEVTPKFAFPAEPAGIEEISDTIEIEDDLDELLDDEPEAIPFHSARGGNAFFADVDAEENLDRIDQHMTDLEEDFQPAGSIGPEVEIVFDPSRDPFGEPFAEEEVVLDRYTTLETDIFGNRPLVTSREGRELSALLSAYSLSTSDVPPPRIASEPAAIAPAIQPANKPTIKATPAPAPQRTVVVEQAPAAVGTLQSPIQISQPVYYRPEAAAAEAAEASDDDLIVVEEDSQITMPAATPNAPLVRRQEYRQLFAKLRRG